MATIDEIDVRDLQCVVTLAETLNFTETANRLHTTQPGVTARITRIEKNHGYKLFDRSKGIVRAITPEGFVFVEAAYQVLERLNQLVTQSDAAHRAFSGRLIVSRSHHADLRLLSLVIAAQSSLAGTHITIQSPGNSDDEAIEMLVSGKVDVALVAWPVRDERVVAIHLTHDTLLAVLPENHAFRDRAEVHIADLRSEQIIGSEYQFPGTLRETFQNKCREFGFIPGCLRISASPAESVYLVDDNVAGAITIVTKQYAKEFLLTRAAFIAFPDGELGYEYGVAYRQSDHRPILNRFLQYLVDRCRPLQDGRHKRRQGRINSSEPK